MTGGTDGAAIADLPEGSAPAGVSDRIAGLFDLVSESYDRVGVDFFRPIAAGLVAALDLAPGQRVLDVGCGRGAVLTLAAPIVAPSDRVLGVDMSQGMLDRAREELDEAGLDWVELARADGQRLELPAASFDVISASLVLFFMPDPPAALKSWFAVLATGGRVGVTSFGGRDPRWAEVDAVFTPYLPPDMLDPRTTGVNGPFGSDGGVQALLTESGFVDVRTTHTDVDVSFADTEHWRTWTMSTGQRAMWNAVPEADRSAVQTAASQRLEDCVGPDGRIHLSQQARNTVGTKP